MEPEEARVDPVEPKKKLLVVDDDAFFCKWVHAVLKHPEVEIQYASNGVEAVALARRWLPDVILMDAILPAMDGFAAFRLLRQDERLRRIKVIFMSGAAQEGALDMAKDLGAWATLKKPIAPKVARRKVYEALDVVADSPLPKIPYPGQEGEEPAKET